MRSAVATQKGVDRPESSRAARKVENPLQRGSACLSCRKRKMKCDATKPVCRQCVKANRSDDCEYDDGRQKSRTQILQEKIAKLEDRIRELDSSASDSSSSLASSSKYNQLSLGNLGQRGTDSADNVFSSRYSPLSPSLSASSSPQSRSIGTPSPLARITDPYSESDTRIASSSDAFLQHGVFGSQDFGEFSGGFPSDPQDMDMINQPSKSPLSQYEILWYEPEYLAPTDRDVLLNIFMPHSQQCGFTAHPERLRSEDGPHPALMNAIYVLACHFSHSQPLAEQEPRFLTRALRGVSTALEHSDRLVDIVQASCLLAVYFYSKARLLEGYYHASSAARLAVTLGLHQIRTPVWNARDGFAADAWQGFPCGTVPVPPPKDALELGERIHAFWQVFVVDRCWSVATGLPSSLPDDDHPQLHISTVWPNSISDFQNGNLANIDYSTLDTLYTRPVPSFPICPSTETLRAKAAAFFERASRVASLCTESGNWDQFSQMEISIVRFLQSLPFYSRTALAPSGESFDTGFPMLHIDYELVAVHTLMYVSTIQLHHENAQADNISRMNCVNSARSVTYIVRQLGATDFPFLDPIIGACWLCAAEVFIREKQYNIDDQATDDELDTIISALKALSHTFPLAHHQAEKIERSRAELSIHSMLSLPVSVA
ncbi:hypothetical protein BD410DRAFT_899724 [Rickenella mellea]|uniref:Zn(2)-C6 fungal-type domain-containing protein n=1 Tax=Rickenella mellea TaxID=50990 RepID=A0A4Y7PZT7_9AGAM|nr:hypothetical protein BD410DRAFT_899724 [Rickenella mellea]